MSNGGPDPPLPFWGNGAKKRPKWPFSMARPAGLLRASCPPPLRGRTSLCFVRSNLFRTTLSHWSEPCQVHQKNGPKGRFLWRARQDYSGHPALRRFAVVLRFASYDQICSGQICRTGPSPAKRNKKTALKAVSFGAPGRNTTGNLPNT